MEATENEAPPSPGAPMARTISINPSRTSTAAPGNYMSESLLLATPTSPGLLESVQSFASSDTVNASKFSSPNVTIRAAPSPLSRRRPTVDVPEREMYPFSPSRSHSVQDGLTSATRSPVSAGIVSGRDDLGFDVARCLAAPTAAVLVWSAGGGNGESAWATVLSDSTSRPLGCTASGGAGVSVSSQKLRRSRAWEEVELSDTDDARYGRGDLDDFVLASAHSCRSLTVLPRSAAVTPVETALSGRASTFFSPLLLSAGADWGGCGPRGEGAAEGMIEFLSFRRPGARECAACNSEIALGANFCSHCGARTGDGQSSPMLGFSPRSAGTSCVSLDGSNSATASSPLRLRGGGEGRSFLLPDRSPCSPAVIPLPTSGSPGPRRTAYRRFATIVGRDDERAILGAGATGEVLRAIDPVSGQQLAVKQIVVDPKDRHEVAAIRNELRLLPTLRHPNIVEYLGCSIERITRQERTSFTSIDVDMGDHTSDVVEARNDVDSDDGEGLSLRVCILMERMECGTLQQLLGEFPDGVSESAVRHYVSQLVDAVAYIHGRGLMHRDIKPANVLLSSDGVIKLSDFGSALSATSSVLREAPAEDSVLSSLTARPISTLEQRIAGTPAYMPPEALASAGKTGAELALYSRAQDIWAVGCVAHQLLTGTAPWSHLEASNPFALLLQIQKTYEEGDSFPIEPSLSPNAQSFCQLCFQSGPVGRTGAALLTNHPFVTDTVALSISLSNQCDPFSSTTPIE